MSIRDTWSEVLAWCAANAPATAASLRPAAQDLDVAGTRALFDGSWPADLVEWFSVQDGIDAGPATGTGVLPGWPALSHAEVRKTTVDMRTAAGELETDDPAVDARRERAGTYAPTWLTSFVPVARDVGTDLLVVDTRPGPRHGVLLRWSPEDGTSPGPRPTLTKLLEGTLRSLRSGTAFTGLAPQVVNGSVTWSDPRDPSRQRVPDLPPRWAKFDEVLSAHRSRVWDEGYPLTDDSTMTDHEVYQHCARLKDIMVSVLTGQADDAFVAERFDRTADELRSLRSRVSIEKLSQRATEVLALVDAFTELQNAEPHKRS